MGTIEREMMKETKAELIDKIIELTDRCKELREDNYIMDNTITKFNESLDGLRNEMENSRMMLNDRINWLERENENLREKLAKCKYKLEAHREFINERK